MAKGIYLGIDSLSRKVKKMYLGIEGVARKVKKAYIGVNGIARLFFAGGGKPVYDGLYSMVSPRKWYAAIAATKQHWILSGGKNSRSSDTSYVPGATSYDEDYTETATGADYEIQQQCGVNFDGKAVFACGSVRGNSRRFLYAYEDDLTYITETLSDVTGYGVAGAATAHHLVLAGSGIYGNGSEASILDEDFTDTIPASLSTPAAYMSGASLGTMALFYGGEEESWSGSPALTKAYVFDDDGVRQDIEGLPQYSYGVAAASLGDKVVLAGGGLPNSTACVPNSYVMDTALTRTAIGNLITPRKAAAGLALGGTALIISGNSTSGNLATAEYYDDDLTSTTELAIDGTATAMFLSGNGGGAATVGDQALVNSSNGIATMMTFHSE